MLQFDLKALKWCNQRHQQWGGGSSVALMSALKPHTNSCFFNLIGLLFSNSLVIAIFMGISFDMLFKISLKYLWSPAVQVHNTLRAKFRNGDKRWCRWHCDSCYRHCFALVLHPRLPFFFFFSNTLWRETLEHWTLLAHAQFLDNKLWSAKEVHKLCFPCATVTYFWDDIFDRFLLPTCWWTMRASDACLKTHPFLGPLNWQTLCLGDGMKTNEHRQAAVNGASWTSFCPRWSAIMSVTIWQFIWADPTADNCFFSRHHIVCILLPFVGEELTFCRDFFPLQWVRFQSLVVDPGLHQDSRVAQ